MTEHTRPDPASVVTGYDGSIVFRRWLGAWIDLLFLFGCLLIPNWVLGNALYQKTLVLWLGIIVLYFPLSEGLTGRSLGKVISRTRVVDREGSRPGVGRAIVRTLLRIVEVNPLLAGGLPAGIVVLLSKTRQRLGDMAAGTYVLREADFQRLKRSRSS